MVMMMERGGMKGRDGRHATQQHNRIHTSCWVGVCRAKAPVLRAIVVARVEVVASGVVTGR